MALRSQIFRNLDDDRKTKQFCDLTVKVDGQDFHLHRNIMSSASSTLRELISNNDSVIQLNGCTARGFEFFVDYVYTEEVTYDASTVLQAIEAANLLDCKVYKDACVTFMKRHIDKDTCLPYMAQCDSPELADIQDVAMQRCCENLKSISKSKAFGNLTQEVFEKIILSPEAQENHRQIDLFKACLKWCKENTQVDCMDMVMLVDFDQLCSHDLEDLVDLDFIKAEAQNHVLTMLKQRIRNLTVRGKLCTLEHNDEDDNDGEKIIYGFSTIDNTLFGLYDVGGDSWMNESHPAIDWMKIDLQTQIVHVANRVLFIGGLNSKSCYAFDRDTEEWMELPDTRMPRSGRAIAVYEGAIYLFGGEPCHASTDRFDVARNKWKSLADAPLQAECRSACVVDDTILVSGGYDGKGGRDEIHEYSIHDDCWQLRGNLIKGRFLHLSCAYNKKMYSIGSYLQIKPFVEVFDLDSNQATSVMDADPISKSMFFSFHSMQVSPSIVFIHDVGTDDFIVLDLEAVTTSRKTIAGLRNKVLRQLCCSF